MAPTSPLHHRRQRQRRSTRERPLGRPAHALTHRRRATQSRCPPSPSPSRAPASRLGTARAVESRAVVHTQAPSTTHINFSLAREERSDARAVRRPLPTDHPPTRAQATSAVPRTLTLLPSEYTIMPCAAYSATARTATSRRPDVNSRCNRRLCRYLRNVWGTCVNTGEGKAHSLCESAQPGVRWVARAFRVELADRVTTRGGGGVASRRRTGSCRRTCTPPSSQSSCRARPRAPAVRRHGHLRAGRTRPVAACSECSRASRQSVRP